ncbi:MAG: hypothetical protein V3V00_05425 [Saprospiraceae bacterium]
MNLNWSYITLCISSITVIALWCISYLVTQNRKVENIHFYIEKVEGPRELITIKEIKQKVNQVYDLDASNILISDLDLATLENFISADNRILHTDIFLDAKRELHVKIIQRWPIVRIIDASGAHYYLDQDGEYISKEEFKAIRVPVATGDIETFDEDWKNRKGSKIRDCFTIIKALRKDKFFTALVEQIHFENNRIKMIPKMGSAAIVINDLAHLDRKLNNLKLFYETEMTHNNAWGKYSEIDISIKNQVISRTTNP